MKCPRCPNETKFTILVVASCGASIDLAVETTQEAVEDHMVSRIDDALREAAETISISDKWIMCDECNHQGALADFGPLHAALKDILVFDHVDDSMKEAG